MRKSRFKCMALAMAMGVASIFTVAPNSVSEAAESGFEFNETFYYTTEPKEYTLNISKLTKITINTLDKVMPAGLTNRPYLCVTITDEYDRKVFEKGDIIHTCDDDVVYLRPGEYTLRIGGVYTGNGTAKATRGEITSKTITESFPETVRKNNDVEGSATVLKNLSGKEWNGVLSKGDEYDYYKFTLDYKSNVAFTLRSNDIDPVFTLTNASGKMISDSASASPVNDRYSYTLPKGTYYLGLSRKDEGEQGAYFFSLKSTMIPFWQKNGSKFRYMYQSGKYYKNRFKKISGKTYYFNKNGYRVTGFKKVGSQKYYFNKNGVMQKGWKKINKKWFYFKASGAMVTGKKKIGNKVYRFNKKGVCLNR